MRRQTPLGYRGLNRRAAALLVGATNQQRVFAKTQPFAAPWSVIARDSPDMFANTGRSFKRKARRMLTRLGLRRFVRRNDGAAAVEFGLVLLPFLAILFAIIETALAFFAQQTLETVTANTARLILTGQAQAANYNLTTFQQMVCQQFVVAMFNCNTNLFIDVRTYSSFSSVSNSLPISNSGNLVNNFIYQPGNPGDIVVVRVMYEWPIFVNLMGNSIANMSNNTRLLVATAAFRNEPY
jgi:Flp pilus assembly protein TadG